MQAITPSGHIPMMENITPSGLSGVQSTPCVPSTPVITPENYLPKYGEMHVAIKPTLHCKIKHKTDLQSCITCNPCPHGRIQYNCFDCGGKKFCSHGKGRLRCKDCNGVGICHHGKIKYNCASCRGSNFCTHGKQKAKCTTCGSVSICLHGKQKYYCKDCGGKGICEHGKRKDCCSRCKAIKLLVKMSNMTPSV